MAEPGGQTIFLLETVACRLPGQSRTPGTAGRLKTKAPPRNGLGRARPNCDRGRNYDYSAVHSRRGGDGEADSSGIAKDRAYQIGFSHVSGEVSAGPGVSTRTALEMDRVSDNGEHARGHLGGGRGSWIKEKRVALLCYPMVLYLEYRGIAFGPEDMLRMVPLTAPCRSPVAVPKVVFASIPRKLVMIIPPTGLPCEAALLSCANPVMFIANRAPLAKTFRIAVSRMTSAFSDFLIAPGGV